MKKIKLQYSHEYLDVAPAPQFTTSIQGVALRFDIRPQKPNEESLGSPLHHLKNIFFFNFPQGTKIFKKLKKLFNQKSFKGW